LEAAVSDFVSFEKDVIAAQEELVQKETEKLLKMHRERPAAKVKDYTFQTPNGPATLSQLFADFDELILIHNMGPQCNYCTLWADGFTGFNRHLVRRAGFAVVNNESVENQQKFAKSRSWNFKMISAKDTSFSADMGFAAGAESKKGGFLPGISIFSKDASGQISHRTRAGFGPGDLFSEIWAMFGMLPSWEAKQYEPN
jgi:predicted dithiol-disulfide oxidoreductase (DUF899 family)